jgi:hypothetical protein
VGGARAGWRWAGGALAAALTLAGCSPWHCDFESHGACIEFERDPPDLEAARARVDRLLELELPYWDLHDLSGWRIQFRTGSAYVCYLATRNDGCTDYLEKTLSVRVPEDCAGCFEAAELQHELGHYALGDPMHANPLWDGVDARFAPVVWDRPDAAPECRTRYDGLREGMWPVNRNSF